MNTFTKTLGTLLVAIPILQGCQRTVSAPVVYDANVSGGRVGSPIGNSPIYK